MEKKTMSTDAQIRASRKYNKNKTVPLNITFNKVTDADIIAHLEKYDRRPQYIRKLIRDDITRQQANTTVAAQFSGDPMIQITFKETEQKVSDIAVMIYNALPEDIQEQISVLVVAGNDNPDGYDIIEAALFSDTEW